MAIDTGLGNVLCDDLQATGGISQENPSAFLG